MDLSRDESHQARDRGEGDNPGRSLDAVFERGDATQHDAGKERQCHHESQVHDDLGRMDTGMPRLEAEDRTG